MLISAKALMCVLWLGTMRNFQGHNIKQASFSVESLFWEPRLQLGRNRATYNFTEFYYRFDTQWGNILEMISCKIKDICITRFCSDKFFVVLQTNVPWKLPSWFSVRIPCFSQVSVRDVEKKQTSLKSNTKENKQTNK